MGLDTEDMTVFLAVVREGSFGRAAGTLMMAQPSVSERIARLERTLGTALFTRGARGAVLTGAGEQLVPFARRVLDLFDEAARTVRHSERTPPLRVGVHATFAHRAVPLLLEGLGDLRRRVSVRDAHSDEVIAMLLDGVVDVGFVLPGGRPRPLRFVPLEPDPVVAVCAPGHPLAERSVGLRALAGHRVAVSRWGAGTERFLRDLEAAGMAEWRVTECSEGHTAAALARDGEHVALVTRSIVDHDLATGGMSEVRLRPAIRWQVPLALAYRVSDRRDPLIQTLHRNLGGRA